MLCLHEEFNRHHRPGDAIPGEGFPGGLPMARRGTSDSAGGGFFFGLFIRWRFLFEERKIDWRVVNWCRLTSWTDKKGINWLQIPYFNTEGRLIGIQNRNLDYKKKQDAPRFRFPYGARCSIYNLPVVKRLKPGERLFITEGCSDCWAMLSAGHKAIAIPSATLLKPEDKQLLTDIGKLYQVEFHMFPDQDVPGESLFMQLREMLPQLVHHQLPPGCKDFSEYYLLGAAATSGSKEPINK